MFNIYYINYAKAFEIAMLFDNKIMTEQSKEKDTTIEGAGEGDVNVGDLANLKILEKFIPKIEFKGEVSGQRTKKVIDTVQVVSTKSTILNVIYKKAKEVKQLNEKNIGQLVKLKDISLEVKNLEDVQASKTLMSGILRSIPVEGVGDMDLTGVVNVFLKDSAYILLGTLKKEISDTNKVVIKIPMQADNELENLYSISDLEIGPMSILGIYRGTFELQTLLKKIDLFQSDESEDDLSCEIESSDEIINETNGDKEKVHFIDVISIIQELTIR